MFSTIFSPLTASASTSITDMTGVYYDLKQDKDFDEADYPLVEDDYSLKVIQIVEASNGSLFLYVYKPSGDTTNIVATKVLMSNTGENDGLDYYDLELLSAEGVFHKYLIKGLERQEEYTRKYLIFSIFRAWNEDYGDSTQEGTIGSEKVYPVEVIFTYHTAVDGTVTLSAEYTEDTITVIDECAGDIFYRNATATSTTGYKSHYYAFSTNKPIDAIHTAYIEFDYDYHYYDVNGYDRESRDESKEGSVVITKDDIINLPSGSFWFEFWDKYANKGYDYPRINSTEAFLSQEGTDLTEEARNAISQQEWIFRYYESNYDAIYTSTSTKETWSQVTKIRLFRLVYEYDGKIYDVGVIADEVGEDGITDGYGKPTYIWEGVEDAEWWQKIMAVVLLILLIVVITNVIFPIATPIFKIIFIIITKGLGALISISFSVLTFPLRLIFNTKRK